MTRDLYLLLILCPLVLLFIFFKDEKGPKKQIELSIYDDFSKLMGLSEKKNAFSNEVDRENYEIFEANYKQNQHLQFEKRPNFKIPRQIHFIWLGPRPFPQKSVEHVRRWIAYHPDWIVNFWTDRQRPPPVQTMNIRYVDEFHQHFFKEHYEKTNNWAEKSDLLRYEILYQEGGIYVDHDADCLRPFHNLNQGYDFYTCLEVPHDPIGDLRLTSGIGVLGSRSKHPIIRGAIEDVLERWETIENEFCASDAKTIAQKVMNRTYLAMTRSLPKNLSKNGNADIVLPASYFYALKSLPSFYSKHEYGNTWTDIYETPKERLFNTQLKKRRQWNRTMMSLEIIASLLALGSFLIVMRLRRTA